MKINFRKIIRIKLKIFKWIIVFIGIFLVLYFLYGFFATPNQNRNWEFGQEKQAKINIEDEKVIIENMRDFDWEKNKQNLIFKYTEKKFDLEEIKSTDILVSHFSKQQFIAHVFVIFNLKNGQNFGVSIESRRDKKEKFSLVGGMWYKYNLIYIFATENDLLGLRKKRNEELYRYPLTLNSEESQKLFKFLSEDANTLIKKPKFYNSILTNCTNVLIEKMETVKDFDFPFLEKYFLPGYTDEALYKEKLLSRTKCEPQLTWEEYKKTHLIKF